MISREEIEMREEAIAECDRAKRGSADILIAALMLARKQHAGQFRERTNGPPVPYFEHILDVVEILCEYDAGEQYPDAYVIAALHDVAEDTDYGLEQIGAVFGPKVLQGVAALTLPVHARARQVKLPHQVAVMLDEGVPDVVRAIKIADKISNVRDLGRYAPDWSQQKCRDYVSDASGVVAAACVFSEAPLLRELAARFARVAAESLAVIGNEVCTSDQAI